jgi:hypothetical protein
VRNDVLARWVAALRSGDYRQGTGRLRRGDLPDGVRYCCLGVLCELARTAGVVELTSTGAYRAPSGEDGVTPFKGVLPPSVRRWAGLTDADPRVAGAALSTWNDHRGASFGRIADLLERSSL